MPLHDCPVRYLALVACGLRLDAWRLFKLLSYLEPGGRGRQAALPGLGSILRPATAVTAAGKASNQNPEI